MAITAEQKYLLNKMNNVASKVQLGTLIEDAETVSAGEVALADGKVFVGDSAGKAAATSLTSAQLLVGSSTNKAAAVSVTGDVTISNAGVTAIATGVVIDADVKSDAAIAYSKLAALASARLLVGSSGNVATAVDVTGDVTVNNTGVTAIGANKVTQAMLHEEVMLRSATVSLTQANITNLNATPIDLVAAPGAGKALVPLMVEFFHDYAVAAYTNGGGGHVIVEYADGTDVVLLNASRVTDTADANVVLVPSAFDVAASGTGAGLAPIANSALRITKQTAEFAGGDATNIVKLRVWYRVVTLLT